MVLASDMMLTSERFHPAGVPVPAAEGLASVMVQTARAALGITTAELAASAGCSLGLVEDIEACRLDPALDTVGRLVSSVGLEVRAGAGPEPDPRYLGVDPEEVRRVGDAFMKECEFGARFDVGPPGPLAGTQPEWDGTDPAPAHLFGAGPTRGDGGGWSALIVRCEMSRLGMGRGELARALDMAVEQMAVIESGEVKLPVGGLQVVLGAMGACLSTRLEVYDDHDDSLHLKAVADPDGYKRRMAAAEAAFANAILLD